MTYFYVYYKTYVKLNKYVGLPYLNDFIIFTASHLTFVDCLFVSVYCYYFEVTKVVLTSIPIFSLTCKSFDRVSRDGGKMSFQTPYITLGIILATQKIERYNKKVKWRT